MATQDSQGIKLFGKTITFNANITQTIKKKSSNNNNSQSYKQQQPLDHPHRI
ncbi:hypothetical protein AtNW77_Chr1g0032161 [Arabidopsis thaliana]